jgi:hypothetical protein
MPGALFANLEIHYIGAICLGLRLYQEMSQRVFDEICEVLQLKFQHQSCTMAFDGSNTYAKSFGHDLVRLAFREQDQNFTFTRG